MFYILFYGRVIVHSDTACLVHPGTQMWCPLLITVNTHETVPRGEGFNPSGNNSGVKLPFLVVNSSYIDVPCLHLAVGFSSLSALQWEALLLAGVPWGTGGV